MPASPPQIVRTVPALRRAIEGLRRNKSTVALVPTMGALHAGHLALVREAKLRARRVVVSIFVNPAQFAPHEDFATYPRALAKDVTALAKEGVDLVWAPSVQAMYPDGFATQINLQGPAVAGLEDKFRPHFFGGVATVVAKLFTQCRPNFALFGEKDYQQLRVISRMASDLDLGVKVVGCKTVREKDGLALSSRNAYLSASERAAAPLLHRTLQTCAAQIKKGQPIEASLTKGRGALGEAGFTVDYLEARHAQTLAPLSSAKDGPIRLLVAARIGRTRLIDNLSV